MRIQKRSNTPFHAHWPLGPKVAGTEYQDFDFNHNRPVEVPDGLAKHLLTGWPKHFMTDEEANRVAALNQATIDQKDKQIGNLQDRLNEIEALTAEMMAGQVSQARGVEITARLSELLGDKAKPKATADEANAGGESIQENQPEQAQQEQPAAAKGGSKPKAKQ